jgi:hypothetical protein
MSKTNYGKNMMLYTGYHGNQDVMKMIPLTEDCPYVEVIYHPQSTLLIVISQYASQSFKFVDKLDSEGQALKRKGMVVPTPENPNPTPYKQERTKVEVKQEYYIPDRKEQIAFIKQFAVNADTYDYDKWLRSMDEEQQTVVDKPTEMPIFDKDGQPITATKSEKGKGKVKVLTDK